MCFYFQVSFMISLQTQQNTEVMYASMNTVCKYKWYVSVYNM